MEEKSCKDLVMEVVEEASKRFGSSFVVTEESIGKLSDICDAVDNLADDNFCDYIDIDVDEYTKKLTIGITCDDLEMHGGRTNEFFTLIKMVDSFCFSTTSDGALNVEFNIFWIWEGTREC